MPENRVTLINNTPNPHTVKDAEGKIVRVAVGNPVIVTETEAKKLLGFYGFVDASKWVKPTSREEELAKENAAMKAEMKALKAAAAKKDPLE